MCKANFDLIDNPTFRVAAKEFIYARLTVEQPRGQRGIRRTMKPTGTYVELWKVRLWFEYLIAHGHHDLTTVTPTDYAGYLEHARNSPSDTQPRTPVWTSRVIDVLWRLHAYRHHVTGAENLPMPWPGFSAQRVAGHRDTGWENQTPRIPEEVIAPLIRWSLTYMDVAAPDIIACTLEWAALRAGVVRSKNGESLERRLTRWIEDRRTQGRGLPAAVPREWAYRTLAEDDPLRTINVNLAGRLADLPSGAIASTRRLQSILRDAAAIMPLEVGGLPTRPGIDPETGEPWHPGIGPSDIDGLLSALTMACYILIAYLSGMRDSEVTSLKRGCLREEHLADGRTRYWLDGTAFKNERSEGRPASWVVIEPVARAVKLLESLHPFDYLFARHWQPHVAGYGEISRKVNTSLNEFVKTINTVHRPTAGPPPIPPVDGEPWRLTTRQFRRTIAWHIANRPFGVIALKLQYQHVNVATSLGYAGSSESGFRQEIETEGALGRLDDIYTMYERHRINGETSTGPGGQSVDSEFDRITVEVENIPVAARSDRVRSMLRDRAATLHVGPAADCFFRAATAVCQQHVPLNERVAPVVALCDPVRCTNARLGPEHRQLWAEVASEAEQLAQRPGLPLIQVEALQASADRARHLSAGPESN
jgi:integrase